MGPGQWLPDGGLPSPLSSAFHGIMKCKVRNRILLQFSAQYQNMSLPFDCVYSGCESKPTMPLLTQQTDRVCAACQGAGMLDCQGWSWHCCCSHSGAQKPGILRRRMCKSQISSLLRQWEAEISLRLEKVIKDTEVWASKLCSKSINVIHPCICVDSWIVLS